MKAIILLFIIHYSIFLNCFFSSFDVKVLCKNAGTFKKNNYLLFYCKENTGIDIYKYDLKTKKEYFFEHIQGKKDNLYFVSFINNTEVLVKVTKKLIKISVHNVSGNRRFISSKIFRNNSSINEFTENIFVDVNCDGNLDILLPYNKYYKLYKFVKNGNIISYKLTRKLYFSYIETRRKQADYDNMWFKIGFMLAKVSSFKYKNLCYNVVLYPSAGYIDVYKNVFSKKIARIKTIKSKDKYEEFIVYPRPYPFIYCIMNSCSLIHFEYKNGIVYNTNLYYPYKTIQTVLIKGSILDFYHISDNLFFVLYLPKMRFFGFYNLLTNNELNIKLAIVREINGSFEIVFEIALTTKIALVELEGFITIRSCNLACVKKNPDSLEITFNDKDAMYKYIIKTPIDKKKITMLDKSKMENLVPILERFDCFKENDSLILYFYPGKIKYLEKK